MTAATPTPTISAGIKTIIAAHPIGLTFIGGALIGSGGYYLVKKYWKKDKDAENTEDQTVVDTESATAAA